MKIIILAFISYLFIIGHLFQGIADEALHQAMRARFSHGYELKERIST